MSYAVATAGPNELSVVPFGVYTAEDFNAVADGTAVTTWVEKNATGRNLTYIGTVQAPYVSTTRLNGNKVVECDAVDSRMSGPTPTYGTDCTLSAVCKVTGPAVAGYRVCTFGESLRINTLSQYSIATSANALSATINKDVTNWFILTVTKSGSTINVYHNGTLVTSYTNSDALHIAVDYFGSVTNFGLGQFMKTFIAEINEFNSALSRDEVLKNQRYLKFKWGV